MANYAVRIYDEDLKRWLIAEAARRGPGVRTSDVVEEALRALQGGSDAGIDRDRTTRLHGGSRALACKSLPADPDSRARPIRVRRSGEGRAGSDVADAPDVEVPVAASDPVRSGDAPDRGAVDADAAPREAVVQPVPAVDPGPRMVMPERILWPEHEFKEPPAAGAGGPIEPVLVYDEPVQRVKGPDSGPDEELGF